MSAGLGRAFSTAVFTVIVALAVWAWLDPGATSRAPLRLGVMLDASTVPDLGVLRPLVAASRLAGGPALELVPATLAELRQAPAQWTAALVSDRVGLELEKSGWCVIAAVADSAAVSQEMGMLVAAPGRRVAVERLLAGLRALPGGDTGSSPALAGLQFLAIQVPDPASAHP